MPDFLQLLKLQKTERKLHIHSRTLTLKKGPDAFKSLWDTKTSIKIERVSNCMHFWT